jgi:Integrase core domain
MAGERFHLTLQEETTTPPATTPRQQQARFDRMRREFNTQRPHEALGQQPPARHYVPSPRPYPTRLEEPWYDATHQVRRVRPTGQIKWQGELVFISEAFRRHAVGLVETERGDWLVRFMRRTGPHRSTDAPLYGPVAWVDGTDRVR